MDEVARRRRLAWGVGFEISKDLVLQFTVEGLSHQPRKALQTMRVVGETEFTEKDKQSIKASQTGPNSDAGLLFMVPVDLPDFRKVVEGSLWHVDGVVQGDHVRFTVDPQHRGGDVLREIALQQTHD